MTTTITIITHPSPSNEERLNDWPHSRINTHLPKNVQTA